MSAGWRLERGDEGEGKAVVLSSINGGGEKRAGVDPGKGPMAGER